MGAGPGQLGRLGSIEVIAAMSAGVAGTLGFIAWETKTAKAMLPMRLFKVKPDRVTENEELIRAVYAEFGQTQPAGLRYVTFQLDDGATFVHIAQHPADAAANPLTGLPAFQRFQGHVSDRCEQAPTVTPIREIGSYRVFHD